MVKAILRKKLGPPMPKQNNGLVFRKTKRCKQYALFPCKTDAVNKKFFSPLSRNSSLSKTALGESYILMIDRHLDAKKKHVGYKGSL